MKVYLICPICEKLFLRYKKAYIKGLLNNTKNLFCSRICKGKGDSRSFELKKVEKFLEKVDKTPGWGPTGDCWIWMGTRDIGGYGVLGSKFLPSKASHASLLLFKNLSIEAGFMACHSCDNPPCVNPDHLWIGTRSENAQDMIKKGRHKKKIIFETPPPKDFSLKYNLSGIKIGSLTYIKRIGNRSANGESIWLANCDCGNESKIDVSQIKNRRMCKECSINKFKNSSPELIGERFGKLTVFENKGYSQTKSKDIYWKCQCDCGGTIITRTNRLLNGEKESCNNCK